MQGIGLKPGGVDGNWTQDVPMMRTVVKSPLAMTFTGTDFTLSLEQGSSVSIDTARDLQNNSRRGRSRRVCGFWHPCARAKTGMITVTLISLASSQCFSLMTLTSPRTADEPAAGRFGNRRMTYYGRWAYKFEEAARRGALGALVIHETEAAGYDWTVAAAGAGENVSLANKDPQSLPVTLQGWLHNDAATQLLAGAGLNLNDLRIAARNPNFKAFELDGVKFATQFDVDITRFDSRNVLGVLPGGARADEIIMASAHWDAYGIGAPDEQGRTVRAGANDDALGSAGILELARVLKAGPALERSIVFAFWTAEEAGLVGSKAYAAVPIFPIETTVANFTLDILQTAGASHDVILVGKGQSDLEDDLARAAQAQGRYVTQENLPENGLFYRADHFSMARVGVPVLLIMGIAGGADLVDGGREAGDQWIADYVGNCYHKPCDAWSDGWDLTGAIQDIELFQRLIAELANSSRWPSWKAGSEFKSVRDQSRNQRDEGNP